MGMCISRCLLAERFRLTATKQAHGRLLAGKLPRYPDFVLQGFRRKPVDAVKRRDELCAPQACIDYAFHTGVKDLSGNLTDSMAESVKYGVSSFKVFMVYDFGVTDGLFYQVLRKAKEIGALIGVHAEKQGDHRYAHR